MRLSVHIDNKNKDILILGEVSAQRLDGNTLKAKVNILLILHNQEKDFVLSLHYNKSNGFLFINATDTYQFKDSEIKDYTLCLGNISKDFRCK